MGARNCHLPEESPNSIFHTHTQTSSLAQAGSGVTLQASHYDILGILSPEPPPHCGSSWLYSWPSAYLSYCPAHGRHWVSIAKDHGIEEHAS